MVMCVFTTMLVSLSGLPQCRSKDYLYWRSRLYPGVIEVLSLPYRVANLLNETVELQSCKAAYQQLPCLASRGVSYSNSWKLRSGMVHSHSHYRSMSQTPYTVSPILFFFFLSLQTFPSAKSSFVISLNKLHQDCCQEYCLYNKSITTRASIWNKLFFHMLARGVPFTVPAEYLAVSQGCILYPSLAPLDREKERGRERWRGEWGTAGKT